MRRRALMRRHARRTHATWRSVRLRRRSRRPSSYDSSCDTPALVTADVRKGGATRDRGEANSCVPSPFPPPGGARQRLAPLPAPLGERVSRPRRLTLACAARATARPRTPTMRRYSFVTVDVFTDRRFGGNPLAVFTDARGLSDADMQALAAELNLSETTFVLPPENAAHTARVRIFNRTAEMPFAGHPNVGTGYVLALEGRDGDGVLRFEEMAGLVEGRIERAGDGVATGATIAAPQPLSLGMEIPVEVV